MACTKAQIIAMPPMRVTMPTGSPPACPGTSTHQLAETSSSHCSGVVTTIEIWPKMGLERAVATSLAMQPVSQGEHWDYQLPWAGRFGKVVYPEASVTPAASVTTAASVFQ